MAWACTQRLQRCECLAHDPAAPLGQGDQTLTQPREVLLDREAVYPGPFFAATITKLEARPIPTEKFVLDYQATQAFGLGIPSTAFTYNSGQSCGIGGYSSGNQVTASYAFQSLVGSLRFLPQLNVTLSAKSCRP